MIEHPLFPLDPWNIRETALDLDVMAQTESIFALSNGHIGWRANLDEGEPHVLPGTYLNGVHELLPLPYAEAGFGYPESGQAVLNVTNGKLIRLLVDDEPFDIRHGHVRHHERVLDFRAGVLRRTVEWLSPTGKGVRVNSTRLVSFTQRAIGAIVFEVEPLSEGLRVVLQSELVANEEIVFASNDPRSQGDFVSTLIPVHHSAEGRRVTLQHSTKGSKLLMAAAMDHEIEGPDSLDTFAESSEDLGRVTVVSALKPGEKVRLVKYVAYGWSGTRSPPALRDQVHGALTIARHGGWEGLAQEQREYMDDFWTRSDVSCEGDDDLQQAVRFALFHVLQSSARAEGRAIPAKGLTGPGYNGHSFWDTEAFVLPLLTYTRPDAAAHALRWRHSILPQARERASQLGLKGAAFPWRTISGPECSSYWPAGTAGFHVNADIADAVTRYLDVCDDDEFEIEVGLEIMTETARLWMSLGYFGRLGRFRIDGVTGPDEYSAIADNNVYTNLMAQHNLWRAADLADKHRLRARGLGITTAEIVSWRRAADAMFIPYDDELDVHPQSENFTKHQRWDFERTPPENYPLLMNYPYFDLYRKQVVKQSDLVLAMHLRSAHFTYDQKARNFDYYEALTVRDSSLSACTQAVIAAEVGHLDLALDYLMETASLDLTDFQKNTRDGVHVAALAGTWSALVAGFGGLRQIGPTLALSPKLPPTMTRLAFAVTCKFSNLRVEVVPGFAEYTLIAGKPMTITHYGEPVELAQVDQLVRCAIPEQHPGPPPKQPFGRTPIPHEKVRQRLRFTAEQTTGKN